MHGVCSAPLWALQPRALEANGGSGRMHVQKMGFTNCTIQAHMATLCDIIV